MDINSVIIFIFRDAIFFKINFRIVDKNKNKSLKFDNFKNYILVEKTGYYIEEQISYLCVLNCVVSTLH